LGCAVDPAGDGDQAAACFVFAQGIGLAEGGKSLNTLANPLTTALPAHQGFPLISFTVPGGVRKVSDRFRSVFPTSGALSAYANQCALYCFFLFGSTSLCALARSCPWSRSVSDLSRAVEQFPGDRFMRRLRASILRRYKGELTAEDFVFAVDDTSNPKYGKFIYRCSHWHDSKRPFLGQKVLVVVLVDARRGFALPLGYAFAVKKTEPDYKSMPTLALDLFTDILAAGFPKLEVTCDSWFDSVAFMLGLKALGLVYAGEIKGNRVLRAGASSKVPWRKMPDFFAGRSRRGVRAKADHPSHRRRRGRKKMRFIVEETVMIRGYPEPVKVIAAYNRRRDKKAFAYHLSTDKLMSGARLWLLGRRRWCIEVMFRDLKQSLSFGRLPCTRKAGSDLAVAIPFAVLTSLRLEPEIWGLEANDRRPIGAKVAEIRERSLSQSFAVMLGRPDSRLVERLRARREPSRLKRKPRCEPAGGQVKAETLVAQPA
jgi:hypothetical protein